MSRRETIRCDRCPAEVESGVMERGTWGRVYAASIAGNDQVGTSTTPADLCPRCLGALVEFMAGRALAPASPD